MSANIGLMAHHAPHTSNVSHCIVFIIKSKTSCLQLLHCRMKLQISASTIAALGAGISLSASDYLQLVNAAVVSTKIDQTKTVYASNIVEYESHLRKKLRAKLAMRRKARGVDEEKEHCTPVTLKLSPELGGEGLDVLGILTEGCLDPTRSCVPDASSLLGGHCTSKEDWLITADHVPSSDHEKSANLKAKSYMEHIVGEECKPIDESDGEDCELMDVGILYQCTNSEHVCIEDDTSLYGGVCAGYLRHRHLTACNYANGTLGGVNCNGSLSCAGLSAAFIANNIGCGSCNGNNGESGIVIDVNTKNACSESSLLIARIT